MGSIARDQRCQRFIDEFNADAIRLWGIHAQFVVEQGLAMHDGWEQVFLFAVVKDDDSDEHGVMVDILMFDPEEPDDEVIARVCDLFRDPCKDEEKEHKRLMARLVKAGLVKP